MSITQEGLNDLVWLLERVERLRKLLPDLQTIRNVDQTVAEKTNALKDIDKKFADAEAVLQAAQDKAKEMEVLNKAKFEEAHVEVVKILEKANKEAVDIVEKAKAQEDIILARVKRVQDQLFNLNKLG